MKVGIVGCGQIAEVQGPLIQQHADVEIVGVADLEIDRARKLGRELGDARAFGDAASMLEETAPDIVHVLVPPQHHAEVAVLAMDRGCHVLVEKPMALTVAEAERMVEAAKRNKVSLCVDHNPLFDHVFQRAIELAREGVVGEIITVEAHEVYDVSRNPDFIKADARQTHWSYRTPGGPLEDMLPHPASLVLEFIPEIEELQVMGLSRGVFPGWQDELRVVVRSDRIMGYMAISANERPDICSLTIKGTQGLIHADSYNMMLTVRRKSGRPRKIDRGLSGFSLATQHLTGAVGNLVNTALGRIDKVNGIENLIAAFYESVRKGEASPVPPESGLRVVDLMNRVWPAEAATAQAT